MHYRHQPFFILSGLLFLSQFLLACSHLDAKNSIQLSRTESWILLPLENLAETPRASERAENLLESYLRNRGLQHLKTYPQDDNESLSLLLNDKKRIEKAKTWAKQKNIRYALTGSVQEWRYKTGLDGEPAVGLTLKLIDLQTDKIIWNGSASRTGWGYENLTGTASKVIEGLLSRLSF